MEPYLSRSVTYKEFRKKHKEHMYSKVMDYYRLLPVIIAVVSLVMIWLNTHSYILFTLLFVVLSPYAFVLKPNYMTRNIFTVATLLLFCMPISVSSTLLMVIVKINPDILTNTFFGYYYLGSIPISSLIVLAVIWRMKSRSIMSKVKVALEYNSWIYTLVLFILFFISNSINEPAQFQRLLPIISVETFKDKGIKDIVDFFSLLMQVASFPFILANSICKSLVEHYFYQCEKGKHVSNPSL